MNINKTIKLIIILTIIVSIFYIPINVLAKNEIKEHEKGTIIEMGKNGVAWPIPGYTRISSNFGKRVAPTSGASTFHKGIDIPAPEGTALIAVEDGVITFTGFLGGGGYTITLSFNNFKVSYCHVSPNYIVSKNDEVHKGDIIGYVGPKYVYNVPGNQYKDANGKPTNGATTGCHLHFGVREDGEYINPFLLFE